MIESSSIKGAKEEVKRAKKDRKHKKDKKRKERENESDRSKKVRRHKRQRKDEQGVNANKKVDDGSEAEFLDKSCLTVELEHQSTSPNSCDSTLYSNERPPKQIQLLDCRQYDSGELFVLFTCVVSLLHLHDGDIVSSNLLLWV